MKLDDILIEAGSNIPIMKKGDLKTADQEASDQQQMKLGTFGALTPSTKCQQKLTFFMQDNNIQNPVLPEDMHCTLLQSSKYVPGFSAEASLAKPIFANNLKCAVFNKKDKDGGKRQVLVVTFNCPEIIQRRERIIKDAGDNYKEAATKNEYIPHITLSYDAGTEPLDTDLLTYNLSQYLDLLLLDSEYEEPLDLNRTPNNLAQ